MLFFQFLWMLFFAMCFRVLMISPDGDAQWSNWSELRETISKWWDGWWLDHLGNFTPSDTSQNHLQIHNFCALNVKQHFTAARHFRYKFQVGQGNHWISSHTPGSCCDGLVACWGCMRTGRSSQCTSTCVWMVAVSGLSSAYCEGCLQIHRSNNNRREKYQTVHQFTKHVY